MNELELLRRIHDLERRAARQEAHSHGSAWVYLAAPLTSTSFDGDAFSTTAKTVIDLSAVFGVPAGIKAVLIRMQGRDSASAGTSGLGVVLSPNSTAGSGSMILRPSGLTNDYIADNTGIVPCDAAGDIYYQVYASGVGTHDLWIEIWGYCLP